VPLAVVAGLVVSLGGAEGREGSAPALRDGWATVVGAGGAAVVTGAGVLPANGFGALVPVVVTGAATLGRTVMDGASVAVTDVTVGDAGVVCGGTGSDATTDGFVCGGTSTAEGADGVCGGVTDTISGTRTRCGASLLGCGGPTGVVVGPVAGSASADVSPPVSAVNETAVPRASPTTNPRPRQVRLIGS